MVSYWLLNVSMTHDTILAFVVTSWMPFWLLARLISEVKSLWAQRSDYNGCYPLHKHWSFLHFVALFYYAFYIQLLTLNGHLPSGVLLPVPTWVQYIGCVCGWLSVFGIFWVHHHLSRNWSPIVQSEQVRSLAKTGPYALCRHPMYFDFSLLYFAVWCIAPCWSVSAVFVFGVLYFLYRIPYEDAILNDAFGEEFREWKKVTPALLPYGCFYPRRSGQDEPVTRV